jgi:hypothetical protein
MDLGRTPKVGSGYLLIQDCTRSRTAMGSSATETLRVVAGVGRDSRIRD